MLEIEHSARGVSGMTTNRSFSPIDETNAALHYESKVPDAVENKPFWKDTNQTYPGNNRPPPRHSYISLGKAAIGTAMDIQSAE